MPKPPTPRTSSMRHSRSTVPAGSSLLLYALFIVVPRRPCYKNGNRMNDKRLLVWTEGGSLDRMRFEAVSRTHVGLVRKINEDSVFADSERGLFAVADGMGGHEAGEIASTMVTDALRCLPEPRDLDVLANQAVETLREVNRELI